MRTSTTLLLSLLTFIPYVSAHGWVGVLTVDGTKYTGNTPSQDGTPTKSSVIRRVSSNNPVKGATNPDINCGLDATAASDVATANPGSVLTFDWNTLTPDKKVSIAWFVILKSVRLTRFCFS